MKKFNICFHFSAIASRTVEAATLEQAIEDARTEIYGSDWNCLGCPEIEVLDYEEVEE